MISAGRDVAEWHAAYRDQHADEFTQVSWIPVKEAAQRLGITRQAVQKRIAVGQWPRGHADLRVIPLQPRPAWFVTEQSLQS